VLGGEEEGLQGNHNNKQTLRENLAKGKKRDKSRGNNGRGCWGTRGVRGGFVEVWVVGGKRGGWKKSCAGERGPAFWTRSWGLEIPRFKH